MNKNKKKINVAVVGLGNCASSLIQGIGYYDKFSNRKKNIGLIKNNICGYKISDINIVAAFDVNKNKIGKPIARAIYEHPNCTKIFYKNLNLFKDTVSPGPVLDGISQKMSHVIEVHNINKNINKWRKDIIHELLDKKVNVLISYLPVGSRIATEFYAKCSLDAKAAFANAMPEFICSDEGWAKKFEKNRIPCAGDDIKSQIGSTIIHRALINLITERGCLIDNTYQLNIGGNTDFLNMLDENRLITKRISKTEAITKLISDYKFDTRIGPSDYVSYLKDNKICHIEINGKQFGNIPFKIDLKLSVEDSPNSAGVMVDIIRLLKVAQDRKLGGYQDFSSYYFKHPKIQISDSKALETVNQFIDNC